MSATPNKIKVLIVDDSVVARSIVSTALNSDPEIEVIATAPSGKVALQRTKQLEPDIISLDFEMPEMDGLETLRQIKQIAPQIPVIMFSSATEHGAQVTFDALALGAADYVTKPTADTKDVAERIRQDLCPRIKALYKRGLQRSGATESVDEAAVKAAQTATRKPATKDGPIEVVGIGVSTGGPNALQALLTEIPGTLSVPVLITQHMPPLFTRLLADRLNAKSSLQIQEAADGMVLKPGHVYIAPGNFHMGVVKSGEIKIALNQDAPENNCRPAVDPMFRSLCRMYGNGVLAVVLTGMGRDGCAACEDVVQAGGTVYIQDEPSSVVWGMPGAVAQAGLAHGVYNLPELAQAIVERVEKKGRSVTAEAKE